jgi:Na+/proline symporter
MHGLPTPRAANTIRPPVQTKQEEVAVKRATLFAAALLMLAFARPGSAQIPARGLSALICLAGVDGNGTYAVSPALIIVVSGDNGTTATVHVTHGGDDSSHVVTYSDTHDTGTLDCGDLILSVS